MPKRFGTTWCSPMLGGGLGLVLGAYATASSYFVLSFGSLLSYEMLTAYHMKTRDAWAVVAEGPMQITGGLLVVYVLAAYQIFARPS